MYKVQKTAELKLWIETVKKEGKQTIGFVPTMGALHEGHLSLIQQSRKNHDITVVSIFVNPTQFNQQEDFLKYPRQNEKDIQLLEGTGCDLVFLPAVEDIYPTGEAPPPHYSLGEIETVLEGKYRPGHFQGVCQVVHRLLSLVEPDSLFLGEKDLQQCNVIERLLHITGLYGKIKLIICDTLREKDGLAMSSRNLRLTPEQRAVAPTIFKVLCQLNAGYGKTSYLQERAQALTELREKGFEVDYLELVNRNTFEIQKDWNKEAPLFACIAATIGNIRLIDNMRLDGIE